MTSPEWHSLWIGEGYNPRVVDATRVASGAYAIRGKSDHVVRYVGESSRGTLWKTLLRHFQAPDSFAQVRETGVFAGDPRKYEVALHVTSRGHRPRAPADGSKESKRLRDLKRRGVAHTTEADQRAMKAQAEWIARLRPTKNKDDGLAGVDPAEEYREHVRKQEAAEFARPWYENPRGAFDEGIALEREGMDLLRPHLYGGKPISDRAKAKGISLLQRSYAAYSRDEYLTGRDAGLLDVDSYRARHRDRVRVGAELRSLNAPTTEPTEVEKKAAKKAARKPKVAPKPEGYGAEDDKRAGQLRMFNPSPSGALTMLGALTRLELAREVLTWSMRDAPALGYDAAGRLFIVYTGRIVRRSTPAEMRDYARTHWGQRGRGKVREGRIAVGPFVSLGPAKSVTYTTTKGLDRELVDYVHPFGEGAPAAGFVPPKLVEHECTGGCGPRCAARGSFALEGGSYRVTARGIVG